MPVDLMDQNDLADFSCLGDHNQVADPYNFTSDQFKVQSDDAEGPLIGDHETQESEGGEADLHKYLVGCKKNPGHSQFIPVETFTLKHLPEGLQDNDLYEYIKVIADLTVRVDVTKSSPHRPEFWPETTEPYPFYNMSERRNLRTGSGIVRFIGKYQDGVKQDGTYRRTAYTKCWCKKCEDLESPSNLWWEFDVYTATHVVFDDIEAYYTTLRLFYDRDDSPGVSVDNVSFLKFGMFYKHFEYDKCVLKCVTCNKNLGNKLIEIYNHYENVYKKFFKKYRDFRPNYRLIFIVLHPHGCSKQVSVGQWKDRYKVGGLCKFTYTTCTCPGSSGANVNCLDFEKWTLYDLVHSGSFKSGLNYSAITFL
ncbi:hypothetical protein BgiBS90_030576 [Biomphalaria glabrata]|nr:hypothetical protein BgiBS90_030576 [Biomphalaria glabrata]